MKKISDKRMKEIIQEELISFMKSKNKDNKLAKEFADRFFEAVDLQIDRQSIYYEKIYNTLDEVYSKILKEEKSNEN